MGLFDGIVGALVGPILGGIIGGSSARSTNQSNEAIAARETEFNLTSAREANALTDKLSLRATKSTEGMTASALALSRSQFDQSQAFNERMSNTAYTRGIADLRKAGLNPILAATRGVTSTPSVSGGPTASGSGTGGSGTAARASQFRKVNEGLQALNSAAALGRMEQELEAMRLANEARRTFGHGTLADKAETIAKTSTSIKRKVKKIGGAAGGAYKRVLPVTRHRLKREWSSLRSQAKRNQAARGKRSTYRLFGPGRNQR